jgi:hypothetical protein
MDFLETVAFLGIGLVGLIALGATFLALWRGASDKPVLLYAMLRRQGDDVARVATASGSRDFAVAVTVLHARNGASAPGSTRASARGRRVLLQRPDVSRFAPATPRPRPRWT